MKLFAFQGLYMFKKNIYMCNKHPTNQDKEAFLHVNKHNPYFYLDLRFLYKTHACAYDAFWGCGFAGTTEVNDGIHLSLDS